MITAVSTRERLSGIVVPGMEKVEEALNLHVNGIPVSARAAEHAQVVDLLQTFGAEALPLLQYAQRNSTPPYDFVQNEIIARARNHHARCPRWARNFDDYFGPFAKTTVEIDVLEPNLYRLGLNVAYVGDTTEVNLAAYLGYPRALWAEEIEVTTEANGSEFVFNFDLLLEKLKDVIEIGDLTGCEVTQALMVQDTRGVEPTCTLCKVDGLRVFLYPGKVEYRFSSRYQDKNGVRLDTWSAHGGVLRGKLRESFEDRGTLESPSFVIRIQRVDDPVDRLGTKPLYKPEEIAKAQALRDTIATALIP